MEWICRVTLKTTETTETETAEYNNPLEDNRLVY